MDKKAQTIDTYNKSAKELAERYDKVGARVSDIEETFALVHTKNPKVLEIGCGNGRDAKEILKRTNKYTGVDVSEGLLTIAKKHNPKGSFELGDIVDYSLPKGLDIIFAFASLIHVNKKDIQGVFKKKHAALHPGGYARISIKYNFEYSEVTKEDEFGTRTYFLYSKEDIESLVGDFVVLKNEINTAQGQEWLEILLQKPREA